jgi:hypothetical protein
VRAIEERFGRGNPDRHKPDARFTRSGESGGWRKLFSDADQEYLDKLKSEFGLHSY